MLSSQVVQIVGRLSRDELAELVQYLQDELSGHDEVTDDVKGLLDDRLAAMDANPDAGRPWPDVEADLRQRLRRSA